METTYIVKVLWRRGVWSRIQMSSRHTLEELHKAIQHAYGLSDSHLYAFFMEGKPWRGKAYWSPGNDEGPFADKITLGQLGLELKQKFLYLYDFGAELKMTVQIEQVLETDVVGLKPLILETRGEGPEEDW